MLRATVISVEERELVFGPERDHVVITGNGCATPDFEDALQGTTTPWGLCSIATQSGHLIDVGGGPALRPGDVLVIEGKTLSLDRPGLPTKDL